MALMLLPIMVLRSRRLMMSMASNIMFTATRLITTWCWKAVVFTR